MAVAELSSLGLALVEQEAASFSKAAPGLLVKEAGALPEKAEKGQDFSGSLREVEERMETKVKVLGLSAKLLAVEAKCGEVAYYEQSLEWRCKRLGASCVEELCKSVVLENTKKESGEVGRIHCVLVIVQYVAKLHKEKLIKVVQGMEAAKGLPPLGKKQYNMRLLEGAACQEITGCGHNAVTPLGQDLPMILSDSIAQLSSDQFWLGGGHVDLKLRLKTSEAIKTLGLTVADVTS